MILVFPLSPLFLGPWSSHPWSLDPLFKTYVQTLGEGATIEAAVFHVIQ